MKETTVELARDAREHATFLLRFSDVATETLIRDIETQRTVLFTLILLARCLHELPPEVQTLTPSIPFRAIRGLRNRIVHSPRALDFEIIRNILQHRIRELIPELDRLVTLLSSDDA